MGPCNPFELHPFGFVRVNFPDMKIRSQPAESYHKTIPRYPISTAIIHSRTSPAAPINPHSCYPKWTAAKNPDGATFPRQKSPFFLLLYRCLCVRLPAKPATCDPFSNSAFLRRPYITFIKTSEHALQLLKG